MRRQLADLENKARAYRNSHADLMSGLSLDQVKERTKKGLFNKTPRQNTRSLGRIFFDNVCSYFNIALFAVLIIQIIAGVRLLNFYTFILPVLANISIGIITDIRAKVSAERLRVIGQQDVNVVRDGKLVGILAEKVVLGDIIHLNSGDQIVADCIIREGSLKVDESLLTGESVPVDKCAGDQLLAGSFVISGHAIVEATKVSLLNYSSSIERQAKEFRRPKSELKSGCFKIFRITAIIATIIGVSMFLVAYFKNGRLPDGSFDFEGTMENLSGSFVAMIPTGLYLLTSITLTKGSIALAMRKINVQELYSIEVLARVDMICFDKTGTLTDGNFLVERIHTIRKMDKEDVRVILSSIIHATEDKNATARALLNYVGENHLQATDALPFTSENKYSAATIDGTTWVLGAPGFIESFKNKEAELLAKEEAAKGFRVLSLYSSKKGIENGKVSGKGHLEAIIVVSDRVKDDAEETIKWFTENDVQIKVISGDDPASVSVIAERCGIENFANYVDLSKVPDSKLEDYADATIFGRASPEQKAHLIKIFQRHGHSVAMTGDGVNDVLALKQADCSIVMGSGSTAAKHCAHLVSVDDNFSKLPNVVFEGRRVINNLQRTSSLFLTKTVFAVLLSIVFLFLSFTTGHQYPFRTPNLFLWEIIVIGAGGVLLAFEPSKDRLKGSFIKNILDVAWPGGVLAALMSLAFFAIHVFAGDSFMNNEQFVTMATLGFSILAYTSLLRISIPFTKYRLFAFLLLVLGGIAFVCLDLFVPGSGKGSFLTVIQYEQLNWKLLLILFSSIILFGGLYFAIIKLIRHRNKKREEKKFR